MRTQYQAGLLYKRVHILVQQLRLLSHQGLTMFSFLTDMNNDLYLNTVDSVGYAIQGSVLVTADGAEALRQVIVNRVRLQRGEYAYNLARGIDYMGLLLTDTPLVRIWEDQVLEMVTSITEVQGIN